jgi:hypothetical protein
MFDEPSLGLARPGRTWHVARDVPRHAMRLYQSAARSIAISAEVGDHDRIPPVILSMVIGEVQTEVSLPEFKEAKQRGEIVDATKAIAPPAGSRNRDRSSSVADAGRNQRAGRSGQC